MIYVSAVSEAEVIEILNKARAEINKGLKFEPLDIVPQERSFLSMSYCRFVLSVFPAVRFGSEGEATKADVEEMRRYYLGSERRRATLMKAIGAASEKVEELNDYNYTIVAEPKRAPGAPQKR